MLVVIPGDVGLFEVPQAGDDEDDEDDEDPSVNGVVETRPLGVLCRFVGIVCRAMLVCGAILVCLLGGLGLLRDGWVASKGEPSACNGDGLGSFEREAEDCFPVSPPFAGFSFVLLRRLLFEVSQAGDDEDDEGSSVTGVVGKKRPSGVLCRFFCSGDADLLEGCCLLCDEVSEVLSDDEQMGLCPTEVGDCFLFPFFCPLPGFFCRLLRDWFCLFKDGPKELVGLEF